MQATHYYDQLSIHNQVNSFNIILNNYRVGHQYSVKSLETNLNNRLILLLNKLLKTFSLGTF